MISYLERIYVSVSNKYPEQSEYLQGVKSFLESISDLSKELPDLEKLGITNV